MGLSSMSSHQAGLALCLVALAVAAPQQDLGGLRTPSRDTAREITSDGVDREEVVAQVMAALTQQIETAVAQALAGLQNRDAGAAAPSPTSQPSDSSGLSSGTVLLSDTSPALLSAAPASQAFFQEVASSKPNSQPDSSFPNTDNTPNVDAFGPTAKPVYNFEYKVAAEADQTYLSHSEQRDGDRLSGVYSYVNPDGALITVNYQAGPQGFSQTLDQQDGFIDFQQEKVSPLTFGALSPSTNSIISAKSNGSLLATTSRSSSKPGFPNSKITGTAVDAVFVEKKAAAIEPRSSLDQNALIAQVISSLQPEISAAVKAALDKSNSVDQVSLFSTAASPVSPASPASRASPASPASPAAPASPASATSPASRAPAVAPALAASTSPLLKGKTTKQAASGARLNSVEGFGRRKAVLSKEKGTGIQNSASVSSERSKGTTGDVLSTFGNGLFVKIKTPHSEISY